MASEVTHLLYVTVSFPYGDVESFFEPEVHELARRGHQVTVVPLRPSGPRRVEGGWRVAVSPLWSRSHMAATVSWAARHPLRLLRASASVLRTSPRNQLRNLAVVPKACGMASLAASAGVDHVHAQWATTTATTAFLVSRLTGLPWSFTAHRHDIEVDNMLRRKVDSAVFVRCISESASAALREVIGPHQQDRVVVAHLGVVVPRALPPRAARSTPVLLCVAALTRRKGHERLLTALASIRHLPWRLELAGTGEERTGLERIVASLGLGQRVTFLGHLDHDALLARYASGSVDGVLLASEHEGIPVSLLEASAHGLPVVATAAGGTVELLGGTSTPIVPVDDTGALASAIEGLLRDPAAARRAAAATNAVVRDRFDVTVTVDALESAITGRNRGT